MTTPKTPIVEGSVVQLKSGGDWMTATRLDRGHVTCIWFDKTSSLREHRFPVTLLTNQADAFSFGLSDDD